MPVGVLEMNPAIPHPALSTAPLGGSFASRLLLRNSLAEPLFRLRRKLFHRELPQIGSPGCMGPMIPQAGYKLVLQPTFPVTAAVSTGQCNTSPKCSYRASIAKSRSCTLIQTEKPSWPGSKRWTAR
jgi:hypothetical protein